MLIEEEPGYSILLNNRYNLMNMLTSGILDKEDVPCEVLYDSDIYVVCDRHADDELYSSKMLLWTGETWVFQVSIYILLC